MSDQYTIVVVYSLWKTLFECKNMIVEVKSLEVYLKISRGVSDVG